MDTDSPNHENEQIRGLFLCPPMFPHSKSTPFCLP